MNNKQRQEWLRAARIFNDYGIAEAAEHSMEKRGVFATYRAQDTGRAFQSAAWQIIRPGYKTDPHGHWRDYGHKTFQVNGREDKQRVLTEAIEWASTRYGYDPTTWVPSPFGRAYGWFPQLVLDTVYEAVEAGAYFDQQTGHFIPAKGEQS